MLLITLINGMLLPLFGYPEQKAMVYQIFYLATLIQKEDSNIANIDVAKPGFINIKFKQNFWNEFVKDIINSKKVYGSSDSSKKNKYLIEFVSANPTGPLHVGHCRGAILGDVISNILKFNNHEVIKEYYVNDYGNQIISFTKSVYLRIREILYNEKDALSVPDTSIMYEGSKKFIYKIIENNMIKKIEVETGVRSGGNLEILKGLNEGEKIVAEGLTKVRPGMKVKQIIKYIKGKREPKYSYDIKRTYN